MILFYAATISGMIDEFLVTGWITARTYTMELDFYAYRLSYSFPSDSLSKRLTGLVLNLVTLCKKRVMDVIYFGAK